MVNRTVVVRTHGCTQDQELVLFSGAENYFSNRRGGGGHCTAVALTR